MYINVVQCNVLYFQIVIPWRQTLDHSVPLLSCIAVIFIIIVVLLLFSVIVTIPFSYYLDLPVSPEVTLFQKDSGVVCHSTGFYPDGVVITWKRDGEDMHKDVNMIMLFFVRFVVSFFTFRLVAVVCPIRLCVACLAVTSVWLNRLTC